MPIPVVPLTAMVDVKSIHPLPSHAKYSARNQAEIQIDHSPRGETIYAEDGGGVSMRGTTYRTPVTPSRDVLRRSGRMVQERSVRTM